METRNNNCFAFLKITRLKKAKDFSNRKVTNHMSFKVNALDEEDETAR